MAALITADTCPSCSQVHGQPTDWPTCPEHGHWLYVLRGPLATKDAKDGLWTYACQAHKCTYTHTQKEKATMAATKALEVKQRSDQLVNWLRGQQDELAMAAASHIKPSTIIRVVQGALRKDDKLMAAAVANPLSLLHCCLDAARLGHEPGTDQYYLVPFGSEVTGIESYKGIIERMFRAGAVSAVVAEVVYHGDEYHRTGATTPPVHEFDEFGDPGTRGPLRGAYAYAVMLDGGYSKVITMGRAEIMKHKAMSRGSDRADSPWQKWEESMWKKCPVRGLEPYVPTSSEWLNARARASRAVQEPAFTPPPLPAGNGHAPPVFTVQQVTPQEEPERYARPVPRVPRGDIEGLRKAIDGQFDAIDVPAEGDERDNWACRIANKDPEKGVQQLSERDLRFALDTLATCKDLEALVELCNPEPAAS